MVVANTVSGLAPLTHFSFTPNLCHLWHLSRETGCVWRNVSLVCASHRLLFACPEATCLRALCISGPKWNSPICCHTGVCLRERQATPVLWVLWGKSRKQNTLCVLLRDGVEGDVIFV